VRLVLLLACVMGGLNGYGVVGLPAVPGGHAVQTHWGRVVDRYTHRFGCTVRQTRVLSIGEPTEERLRAVERYCEGPPGSSLPNQPR